MDSERRGSDNQVLPLVSISSKVDMAQKHASSPNAISPVSETAMNSTNAEPDASGQSTADSQMSSQRHANGERVQRDSQEARPPASVQGAAGDSSYPPVAPESEVPTRRPNAANVRLSKQVSIAASTPTEAPTSSVPQRPERDSVLIRERDTSLSRSVLNESTVTGSAATTVRRRSRIGHRRVDEAGTVTYKRTPTGQLMRAIQMGIDHSIKTVASKPERDILISDFRTLELVEFPSRGTHITPPHEYNDFTFKTYAPYAFRFFRALFGIKSDQFIDSLTGCALIELSNPGASGSIFYLSPDYEFIIKTVQKKEAHFLQKLLPGYYLNLNQNPRTLLPKFYGLYCYCSLGKKIRFVVMNNLLPTVTLHEKYDLKGSTFKREASQTERAKASPTLKDLDFQRIHPNGLEFEPESYQTLMKTLQRDCRVLESFRIMDYSLLLGIHNLDRAKQEQAAGDCNANACTSSGTSAACDNEMQKEPQNAAGTSRSRATYSTASQLIDASRRHVSVDADGDGNDQDAIDSLQIGLSRAGIPARNANGEKLLVYAGIIDILQYYRLAKRLEHAWKSVVTDGNTVSVHHPSFYSNRFLKFFENSAFKKGQPRKCSNADGSTEALEQLVAQSSS